MISSSELILNPDGSIYHLALLPEDVADIIITVGDPNRVEMVSRYFDTIEVKRSKREFQTHTGTYRGVRITAISTGIGPDNIDIVLNELDALVNIDLTTREPRSSLRQLDIIRVGTSGSLRSEIGVDEFVLSDHAVGFDNLLHFYHHEGIVNAEVSEALGRFLDWPVEQSTPYVVECSRSLADWFHGPEMHPGFTSTNVGFYGPQGRQLRAPVRFPDFLDKLSAFEHGKFAITNLEMETAAIYALSEILGHRAVSLNCILANRPNGSFSSKGKESIDRLIRFTLNKIADNN